MSEFKVGDRITTVHGWEYTVTAVGEKFLLVTRQGVGEQVRYKYECTIIPDTIKVELSRQDVEYWADCNPYGTGQASRFYAACRAALAKDNDE